MTSRTTPVGVIVVALLGLIVMGCNAQTSAVFEALLDPATAVVAASGTEPTADAIAPSTAPERWWPHPDGYQMTLPSGWYGVSVDGTGTSRFIVAVASTHPALAERMETVLADTDTRVSAIAADPTATEEPAPILIILAQPTEGMKPHEIKQHVRKQIQQLPGIVARPIIQDAPLTATRGWRFDYSVIDPDLGDLRIRSYLFRFGNEAYLVNFIASEAMADDVDAIFDRIAQSLRFGI